MGTKGSWLLWGRVAKPLVIPMTPVPHVYDNEESKNGLGRNKLIFIIMMTTMTRKFWESLLMRQKLKSKTGN